MSDYEDSFDEDSSDSNSHVSSTTTPKDVMSPLAVPPSVPVPVPVPVPVAAHGVGASSVSLPAPVSTAGGSGADKDRRSTGDDLVERALEAGVWRKAVDPSTGASYFHNVLTKERTSDLRKWLTDESSRNESETSTRRSSGLPDRGESLSTYSETTIGDTDPSRFLRAQRADLNSEFTGFGQYVAFHSNSPSVTRSSWAPGSPQLPDTASSASTLHKTSVVSAPFTSPKPSVGRLQRSSDEHQGSGSSQTDEQPEEPKPSPQADVAAAVAEEQESSSVDPSSVFSTLSQHLKAPAPTTDVTSDQLHSTHDATSGPLSHQAASGTDVPPLQLSTAMLGPRSGESSLMTSSRAALISPASPPALHMTLPDLPQPGLDKGKHTLSPTSGLSPALTVVPPSALTGPMSVFMPQTTPSSSSYNGPVPPPLPSAVYSTPAPVEDPKITELRETSEAVERLVKAFAMLRGHVPADDATKGRSHGVRGVETITAHENAVTRPGLAATMHSAPSASIPRTLPPSAPSRSLREATPGDAQENEKMLEEVLLSCVMEMVQTAGSQKAASAQLVQRLKQRPTHEVVSAESFRADQAPDRRAARRGPSGTGPLRGDRGNVFNLFDGEMRAFVGEDQNADAALYHAVYQALQKYVLAHVVGARGKLLPRSASEPAQDYDGDAQATNMSPYVAWALLLDVLTVCTDILETFFTGTGPHDVLAQPVLVQCCGEPALKYVVTNAMHCLPFEMVSSQASSASRAAAESGSASQPLFRLEFWVTRQKLFVVMEAVRECLRRDILEEASSFPSASFETGSTALRLVHPKALIPPSTPLLAVVPLSRGAQETQSQAWRSTDETRRTTTRPSPRAEEAPTSDGGPEKDFFGVSEKSIAAMTYTVSVIATDLLEDESKQAPSPTFDAANAYDDLTAVVSETVSELLTDPTITTAIKRRAKEKYKALLADRESLQKNSRSEREKMIIAKAEAEAERVVRQIMQELVARDPTAALPRKA